MVKWDQQEKGGKSLKDLEYTRLFVKIGDGCLLWHQLNLQVFTQLWSQRLLSSIPLSSVLKNALWMLENGAQLHLNFGKQLSNKSVFLQCNLWSPDTGGEILANSENWIEPNIIDNLHSSSRQIIFLFYNLYSVC